MNSPFILQEQVYRMIQYDKYTAKTISFSQRILILDTASLILILFIQSTTGYFILNERKYSQAIINGNCHVAKTNFPQCYAEKNT
jgi:hypothetical protein